MAGVGLTRRVCAWCVMFGTTKPNPDIKVCLIRGAVTPLREFGRIYFYAHPCSSKYHGAPSPRGAVTPLREFGRIYFYAHPCSSKYHGAPSPRGAVAPLRGFGRIYFYAHPCSPKYHGAPSPRHPPPLSLSSIIQSTQHLLLSHHQIPP